MIDVSPLAVEKLKDILVKQDKEGFSLRVVLMAGANGGAEYMLALEKEARSNDVVVQAGGVSILLDAESAPYMEGAEIDYVEAETSSGFVINNPNVETNGCACGGMCACR